MSILTRIVNVVIPPVHDVRPDVSPVLDAIARKATRRNRDERYATAEEMRARLEEYLRERKDGVSERDLARMMSDLFADIRDDVRARVKEHVATMPPSQRVFAGATGAANVLSTGKLPVLPSWT